MSNWYRTAKAHPCGVLLAVQILGILLYPFMENSGSGVPCSASSGSWCWCSRSGR